MHDHDHDDHHHDHHDHDHHDHDHGGHVHGDDCGCEPGEIEISITLHDDAVIASGATIVQTNDPERVKNALAGGLEAVAIAVDAADGIIGHIKTSIQITATLVMSLTEPGVPMDTRAAEAVECRIGAAAIVFGVGQELMEAQLRKAFERALAAAQ